MRTQRLLLIALAPFLVATAIGLIVLWPATHTVQLREGVAHGKEFDAEVTSVASGNCPNIPGQENFQCSSITVTLGEGEDTGETFNFNYSRGPRTRPIEVGDDVIVGTSTASQAQENPRISPEFSDPPKYFFVDFDRRLPLIYLAIVFSLVVVALSRWRGLAALAGVAISLLILARFVMPAILEGSNPLLVAIVGSSMIMFLALYLAHGLNASTTTAVLGTLASLFLTGVLALFFVNLSIFTGVGSEEAAFLQVNQQQVNLQGLLLASIIIGTLGVLDDVTITQATAVWELQRANPGFGTADLYRSAIRIGRDHIASTVNTLVLAYAGASLPLMILFSVSERDLGSILNTENVAEEIVRTLVGSIGLVASVPITTGLAALVVTSARRAPSPPSKERSDTAEADDYQRPRRERDFWDEES